MDQPRLRRDICIYPGKARNERYGQKSCFGLSTADPWELLQWLYVQRQWYYYNIGHHIYHLHSDRTWVCTKVLIHHRLRPLRWIFLPDGRNTGWQYFYVSPWLLKSAIKSHAEGYDIFLLSTSSNVNSQVGISIQLS